MRREEETLKKDAIKTVELGERDESVVSVLGTVGWDGTGTHCQQQMSTIAQMETLLHIFLFLSAWKSWMDRGIGSLTLDEGDMHLAHTHIHSQTHIIAHSISTRLFFCCKLQLRVPTSAHLCKQKWSPSLCCFFCFFYAMQCNVGQAHPFVSLGSYVCSLINNQIQDYRRPLFLPLLFLLLTCGWENPVLVCYDIVRTWIHWSCFIIARKRLFRG